MRPLSPPLKVIENNLFMPSESLLLRWVNNDPQLSQETVQALNNDPVARKLCADLKKTSDIVKPDEVTEDNAPPLPPFLKELVKQRIAACDKYASLKAPMPGQILRIDKIVGPKRPIDWDLPHPLAVLISEQTENKKVWSAWIVAPDTDYATHWDMLLERPEDEPFDPFAGMIQIWNPVQIYLPSDAPVLAALKPERLQAVRALAAEFATGPELEPSLSHPGQIAPRTTFKGFSILTGTPIGKDDPRYRYQEIYHTAADILREVALEFLSNPLNELGKWLKGSLIEATENGWRTLEDIFGGTPIPACRKSAVKRAKQINLGADQTIVLKIEIEQLENQNVNVNFCACPSSDQTYLPENLKLTLLSESGEPLDEVQVKTNENRTRQELKGSSGDQFSIKIALGDISVIEDFII